MWQEPLASVHDLSVARSSSLVTGPLSLHFLIFLSLFSLFKLLALDTPGPQWNNHTCPNKGCSKGWPTLLPPGVLWLQWRGRGRTQNKTCIEISSFWSPPHLHCAPSILFHMLKLPHFWFIVATFHRFSPSSCRLLGRRVGFLSLYSGQDRRNQIEHKGSRNGDKRGWWTQTSISWSIGYLVRGRFPKGSDAENKDQTCTSPVGGKH